LRAGAQNVHNARFLAKEGALTTIERSIRSFSQALQRALESEELARTAGLLQKLDPRVKVICLPSLIVAAVISRRLAVIAGLLALAVLLAVGSRVPFRTLVLRAWVAVLLFTAVITLPAIFVTPGRVLARLPLVGWGVTAPGLRSALFLVARAGTAATLTLLWVLSTPWPRLLRSLRMLHVPLVFVAVLGMTYRYILLLLQTASQMFEARRSRLLGSLTGPERRRVATAGAGILLNKTTQLADETYQAMQSRGFTGEVYLLDQLRMRTYDYALMAVLLSACAVALWLGR
jgi:cobalt ECF transporter T component CbiQ